MPVSESITLPSSPSLKAVMRPSTTHAPQGEDSCRLATRLARLRRRLDNADKAIAGKREIDQHEIAWLEHVERERGARQEDGAAQREHGQRLRKIARSSVAFNYPTRQGSLPSRKQ